VVRPLTSSAAKIAQLMTSGAAPAALSTITGIRTIPARISTTTCAASAAASPCGGRSETSYRRPDVAGSVMATSGLDRVRRDER